MYNEEDKWKTILESQLRLVVEESEETPTLRDFLSETDPLVTQAKMRKYYGSYNQFLTESGVEERGPRMKTEGITKEELWNLYYISRMTVDEIEDEEGYSMHHIQRRADRYGIPLCRSTKCRRVIVEKEVPVGDIKGEIHTGTMMRYGVVREKGEYKGRYRTEGKYVFKPEFAHYDEFRETDWEELRKLGN